MIEINDLYKNFGKINALSGINVSFKQGDITAIVGPNGSGKTTLIKIILGLVKQTSGEIKFKGKTISNCSYRKEIGYMPQSANYPDNLTAAELVDMLKDIRGLENNLNLELIELFQLNGELKKPIRTLSGGTKQKINAALAFMFNPSLLILDEPTAALDPISSSYLKDKILKENKNGKTVILTSHNMYDIQELSNDIIFLMEGKVFFRGSPQQLINRNGYENLERAVAGLMKDLFNENDHKNN